MAKITRSDLHSILYDNRVPTAEQLRETLDLVNGSDIWPGGMPPWDKVQSLYEDLARYYLPRTAQKAALDDRIIAVLKDRYRLLFRHYNRPWTHCGRCC